MKYFHNSLPFYATQIINPILNSRISANHDKVQGLLANGEILYIVKSLLVIAHQLKNCFFSDCNITLFE